MTKLLYKEFKTHYYNSLYILFQNEFKKISIEFNLDYQELEDLYLSEFKSFLSK